MPVIRYCKIIKKIIGNMFNINTLKLGLLIICIRIVPLAAQDVRIISDFESASIGSLKEIAPNKFRGQTMHWIKFDQIGNQYYWFYFKAVNVKDKTIRFELDNLTGIYRGNPHIVYTDFTQPVISYDNETWTRIENVSYDDNSKSFNFTASFEHDTAWIAYAHPYPYSRHIKYLESVSSNPNVNIVSQARSPENRTLSLLEITNPGSEKDKKCILVIAMQHAGEDAGGYSVEGIIDYLLSDTRETRNILDNYVYYIVPMMNPDGVYHGVSRYTPKMQDMNDEWVREESDPLDSPVEVEFVKNWITGRLDSNKNIDLFIDIHCHTQRNRYNAFLDRSSENEALRELTDNMRKYWPHLRYSYRYSSGRLAVNYTAPFGIPSVTLEFTQSYESDGDGQYMGIEDYRRFGKDMVRAITATF